MSRSRSSYTNYDGDDDGDDDGGDDGGGDDDDDGGDGGDDGGDDGGGDDDDDSDFENCIVEEKQINEIKNDGAFIKSSIVDYGTLNLPSDSSVVVDHVNKNVKYNSNKINELESELKAEGGDGGEPKDEAKGEAKGEPKVEAKDEAKGEPKDEAKGETKDEAKGETKDEAKGEPKAETKGEPKVEAKDEAKGETKDEAKGEPKAEAKGEPKAEAKGEPKAEAKPNPNEVDDDACIIYDTLGSRNEHKDVHVALENVFESSNFETKNIERFNFHDSLSGKRERIYKMNEHDYSKDCHLIEKSKHFMSKENITNVLINKG
uniref:Uncharacterized protein n=1 Tax=Piliocolobus tephrosceles TaxID=591936 RepID=A0A8C9LJM7_9PRIM